MKQVTVSFWLRPSKGEKSPIYCKIYHNEARADFPTGVRVAPADWSDGLVKGKDAEIKNGTLEAIWYKVMTIVNQVLASDTEMSATLIKNIFLGKEKKGHTLLESIESFIEDHRNDSDIKESTIKQYVGLQNSISNFLVARYHVSDLPLSATVATGNTIASDYIAWCKEKSLMLTTINKNLALMNHILSRSVKMGWVSRSAFHGFRLKTKKKSHIYLSSEELEQVENLPESIYRDLFLFCCYTGLAWADVIRVTKDNIVTGINGMNWIFMARQKTERTGKECKIPVDGKALSILDKHTSFTGVNYIQYLSELKAIGAAIGTPKHFTSHTARHTFAVRMLDQGYSSEAVADMMGHADIAMVKKVYGEITVKRISLEYTTLMANQQSIVKNIAMQ